MIRIEQSELAAVRDRASLYRFLHQSLRWPVDPDDTFAYEGPRLDGAAGERAQVGQIVPFSADDPYSIFLVEFETTFRRGDLREILRRIREEIRTKSKYGNRALDDLVFLCASQGYREFRFARFETRDQRLPKLSSFGWNFDDIAATRTLRQFNLPPLEMPNRHDDGGYEWDKARWQEAWNVSRVTDEFYKEYKKAFDRIVLELEGQVPDTQLIAQRLCNRLLFLQFLAKKGWLNNDHGYLRTLYTAASNEAANRRMKSPVNFYADYLRPLFFNALNTKDSERPDHDDWNALESKLGNVPFLNGGLFAEQDEWDQPGFIGLDNDAFEPMLDLFDAFNFTLTESTPDDIEVAVDPEMLGKVFEELVTGRHDSGSYYTPRPIVAFMCREALKGYLAGKSTSGAEAIAKFVDEDKAEDLSDPETILQALKEVTVCDPACGSGAYLLGMMQELLRLRERLFAARKRDHAKVYTRKLEIIERNLYGVDKFPFAVNIAMLRLWLSLVVDDERHPLTNAQADVALPNLRYKIRTGDSLTGPSPEALSSLFLQEEYGTRALALKRLHHEYFDVAHQGGSPGHKAELETKIETAEREVQALFGDDIPPATALDWRSAFAEVFAPQEPIADIGGAFNFGGTLAEGPKTGGFDVVLANPPYVRHELIKDLKPTLKQVFPEVYTGTADIYCFFYARAIQILRRGGMLVFISSNKWFRATYGTKLRAHVSSTCAVNSIIDFGDLPVFSSAIAYAMVFVASKSCEGTEFTYAQVKDLNSPYPNISAVVAKFGRGMKSTAIDRDRWELSNTENTEFLTTIRKRGVPLREYVSSRLYRGLTTGYNNAFVIDNATRARLVGINPLNGEIVKPLAGGRDISRWSLDNSERWIIVTPIGVDIDRYPEVLRHLSQWKSELEERHDKGDHWWELRACKYYSEFELPKIVSTKVSIRPTFAFDANSHYLGNTAYFLPTSRHPLYVLGVLNSDVFFRYAKETFVEKQNGWYEVQPSGLEEFPIPDPPASERHAIATLVQKCVDAGGVDCEAWEKEIDDRVAALYGL